MPTYAIEVQAEPAYLEDQSDPGRGVHAFSYTITIANVGDTAVQLISRHWIIEDATGHTEEVKGLGAVGHQPLLQPGQSFQYTSGCRLRTPSGMVHGHYFFVADDGERFEAPIPAFVLSSGNAQSLH